MIAEISNGGVHVKASGPLTLTSKRFTSLSGKLDANGQFVVPPMDDYDWTGRLPRSRDLVAPPPLFGTGNGFERSSLPIAWLPENVGLGWSPELWDTQQGNMFLWVPTDSQTMWVPRCVIASFGARFGLSFAIGFSDAVASLESKLKPAGINVMCFAVSNAGPLVPPLPATAWKQLPGTDGFQDGYTPTQEVAGWTGGELLYFTAVDLSGPSDYVNTRAPPQINSPLIAEHQKVLVAAAPSFAKYGHRVIGWNSFGSDTPFSPVNRSAMSQAVGGATGVDATFVDIGNSASPTTIAGLITKFFDL